MLIIAHLWWIPITTIKKEKLYDQYRQWAKSDQLEDEGVVVASDSTLQWLLPWWWGHYQRFNNYPVTFVDLGMSEEMQLWCKQRGRLIPLRVADIFVAEKSEVDPALCQQWEKLYGARFWLNRNAWFKKPSACLQSPYKKSIWIDLDCEVRGSLTPLFALCEQSPEIVIAKEMDSPLLDHVGYNSGVIVFKRGSPLIEEWAALAFDSSDSFPGDQDILSKLIHDKQLVVGQLPLIYNWGRCQGENPEVIIFHWHGLYGKSYIHHQIMRSNLKENQLI